MKGRLTGLARGLDGGYLLTVQTADRAVEDLWAALKDADVSVEIKRHRRRRSLDANAYAWVLIDRLADTLGQTKREVYREAIRGIGGVSDVVMVSDKAAASLVKGWEHNGLGWFTETMPSRQKGCTTVVLYYGSSVYDTAQMAKLIDHLCQDCRAVGIDPTPPYMVAGWEASAPATKEGK